MGDGVSIGRALLGLGRLTLREGDSARALKLARQALGRFQKNHHRWGEAFALVHLGRTALAIGERDEAKAYYRLALESALRLQALPIVLRALSGVASILGPALAQEVWAMVHLHPAADVWVRQEAKRLAGGEVGLPTLHLEEIIEAVLKAL